MPSPTPRRPLRALSEIKLAQFGKNGNRGNLCLYLRIYDTAMALALKPRRLLLDEPTAGMGDQETHEATALIRRLHREDGYTIVLIEHDMRVVFHLSDRIMVLDRGRVLAEGTPAEIAADAAVQGAYLGQAA